MSVEILVAKDSFVCEIDGRTVFVPKGATIRAGHHILVGREESFRPLVLDFEVEAPLTKPGRHVAKKPEGGDN